MVSLANAMFVSIIIWLVETRTSIAIAFGVSDQHCSSSYLGDSGSARGHQGHVRLIRELLNTCHIPLKSQSSCEFS